MEAATYFKSFFYTTMKYNCFIEPFSDKMPIVKHHCIKQDVIIILSKHGRGMTSSTDDVARDSVRVGVTPL